MENPQNILVLLNESLVNSSGYVTDDSLLLNDSLEDLEATVAAGAEDTEVEDFAATDFEDPLDNSLLSLQVSVVSVD